MIHAFGAVKFKTGCAESAFFDFRHFHINNHEPEEKIKGVL